MRFPFLAAVVVMLLSWTSVAGAVTVKDIVSPSGIKAWLVEDHSIPIVSLRAAFAQGSVDDPPQQKGASLLLSGLVDEGANGISGEDFRTRMEDLGLRLSIDDTPDNFEIGFSVPTVSLKEGSDLMAAAFTSLDFPVEAVERMRGQLLTFTESKSRSPDSLASSAFLELALPGHPYARDDDGLLEGIQKLTRDDLISAYKRIFSQHGLKVAVVGDVTEAEAGALLDKLFNALPTGTPLPVPVIAAATIGPKVHIIPFDQPQTLLLFGSQGVPENDPDITAAGIATSIMGATLHQVVREQRGFTYDVSFNNLGREASTIVLGQLRTQNQTADDALAAVKEAMQLALAFTNDENVYATVRYFKGASALGAETNGELAGQLLDLQEMGYASNYLSMSEALLDKVTPEDVRRVMKKMVRPDNLLVVAVGKPEGLTEQ